MRPDGWTHVLRMKWIYAFLTVCLNCVFQRLYLPSELLGCFQRVEPLLTAMKTWKRRGVYGIVLDLCVAATANPTTRARRQSGCTPLAGNCAERPPSNTANYMGDKKSSFAPWSASVFDPVLEARRVCAQSWSPTITVMNEHTPPQAGQTESRGAVAAIRCTQEGEQRGILGNSIVGFHRRVRSLGE